MKGERMAIKDDSANVNETPVVIYVPGLGSATANSADRVADVAARVADVMDKGRFDTRTSSEVAAPRGLTVGKTVVDGADNPHLQFFQYDYASVLEAPRTPAAPTVVPGMFRSATFAVWGAAKWCAALKRSGKTFKTKAQLALGLLAALALIFAALVALFALLVALGVEMPWLDGFIGTDEQVATRTFGIASIGLTITWGALRKKILALAETAERLIRFTKNDGRAADTISFRLDQSLDELRANGWHGPVHLLGYSFGSLVLFEALNPKANSRLSNKPVEAVSSLVTIGCPIDLVRLYEPSYVTGRQARNDQLKWTNVFNEADIFASNLKDENDTAEGAGALAIGESTSLTPTSIRYLDESIGVFQIFTAGVTHSSYWGTPDEASCFQELVPLWMAAAEQAEGRTEFEAITMPED